MVRFVLSSISSPIFHMFFFFFFVVDLKWHLYCVFNCFQLFCVRVSSESFYDIFYMFWHSIQVKQFSCGIHRFWLGRGSIEILT